MPINLIDKIVPKNDAFVGMVDAKQVIGGAGNVLPDEVTTRISKLDATLATGLLKITTTTGALSSITDNSTNWDTAYGWGNHASAGYLTVVTETDLSFTDITTSDATTDKHGLLPKLGGGTSNFLRADGTWATPAGGGDVSDGDTLSIGLTFPNTGLHILDTNASHDLIIAVGSNITADRTFTITTGDNDRTFDISAANVTISSFIATLLDDADASTARGTLDVDQAGTDNSTNVTLDVNADTILSLSTQELGLDNQTANYVFAGPTTGAATTPTFRALVSSDIPDLSSVYQPLDTVLSELTALTDPGADRVVFWNDTSNNFEFKDFSNWDTAYSWGNHASAGYALASNVATIALDNLASVAINTSLISDTDSTDDLGSSSKYWANLYVDKIYLDADSTIIAGDVDGWNTTRYFVIDNASYWAAAYDHSIDNSQAHSDYLINNGNDTTTGSLTLEGGTLTLGKTGVAGSIVLLDGLGGNSVFNYGKWSTLDSANGIISGNGSGSFSASTNFTYNGSLNLKGGDYYVQNESAAANVVGTVFSDANWSTSWYSKRARGTESSPTAVTNASTLGYFAFIGHNGTAFSGTVGAITCSVDGTTFTTGNNPTRLTFSTTPASSTTLAERMRITNAGNVGINEIAPDYRLDVNGTFGFTPGSSVTPVDNGDVVIEATNNTTLTFKLKGSDGTVRSGTVTLA